MGCAQVIPAFDEIRLDAHRPAEIIRRRREIVFAAGNEAHQFQCIEIGGRFGQHAQAGLPGLRPLTGLVEGIGVFQLRQESVMHEA